MGGEKAGSEQEAWRWQAFGKRAHASRTLRPQRGVDGVDLVDDAAEPRVRLCGGEAKLGDTRTHRLLSRSMGATMSLGDKSLAIVTRRKPGIGAWPA
uniref:Uncharacterized protein n=1 Tax=Oryza rufipogon TaxID=4529 RepID=A0A0E0QCB8_ORYRU